MAEYIDVLGQPHSIVRGKLPKGTHGDCSYDKFIIRISNSDPPEVQEYTLLHELLHAIMYQSGFHFALEEHKISEEHLVRVLEHGLWRAGVRITSQKAT